MADFIDTHCHLTHGKLRQQVAGVLDRAQAVGVRRCICAASTVSESKAAAALATEHENVFSTAGVHPHDAKEPGEHYLRVLEDLAKRPRTVAIGEIGLDYHYDFSPRGDQQRIFAEQLELARILEIPVVIHTREAFDDTLAILAGSGVDQSRVVFHSFTGACDEARRAIDLGAMISFSGIVTFKNTDNLRVSAAMVGDEQLLIETDAPYLSPEPVRGMKANEPANVVHVGACIAHVRHASPETIAELTTRNAVRFFSIGDV